jgi:hypothetical protein
MAMTRIQALTGIAVFTVATCGVFLSVQATPPLARPAGTNAAAASRHACVDMNGKTFEWGSSNVPFAATCDAKPETAKSSSK